MAYIGCLIPAQQALEILTRHHEPMTPTAYKEKVLNCGGLDLESFSKLKADQITPASAFVIACQRGYRPCIITSNGVIDFRPVNYQVGLTAFIEDSERIFVGMQVRPTKPISGVTNLVDFGSLFDSTQKGKVGFQLEQLGIEEARAGVHIYLSPY